MQKIQYCVETFKKKTANLSQLFVYYEFSLQSNFLHVNYTVSPKRPTIFVVNNFAKC